MTKSIYVLDTNVLMHDPLAMFSFEEHDVFIPMVVLEELDAGKKGLSETARSVRHASRILDELIGTVDSNHLDNGVELATHPLGGTCVGRLFFQTRPLRFALPEDLPGNRPDNTILGVILAISEEYETARVTLVSKDINLRIKAKVLGVQAEDYAHDKVLDDADLLPTGMVAPTEPLVGLMPQEFVVDGDAIQRVSVDEQGQNQLIDCDDYSREKVWGITAKSAPQNCALNLLLDPEVDFVTLLGGAGSGKTLLSLAAGLTQVLEEKRYKEIIMTRATVAIGEDIGFLPGTEEEKMTPWMGAVQDNLEFLTDSLDTGGGWGRAASADFLMDKIKLRSLSFMRGRTFLNRFIIIDEAQNLTPKQMKTLITRVGKGSKLICLGNIAQIDTPYLTESSSGLTYVVDRFRGCDFAGHVTLANGERSRLADFANGLD